MPVHNLQSEDDVRNAITGNELAIIEFFATWCEASKTIAPVLVEQSNRDDRKNIYFGKVDIDQLKGIAEQMGVTSSPTLQLFKNGERVGESVGPGPQALLQFVENAQK